MEHLIIFILSTVGLSWIMVRSKLFKTFREFLTRKNNHFQQKNWIYWFLDSIYGCTGCFGVWAGLINYFIVIYIPVLAYAFIGSFTSLFFISLLSFIEKK